MPRPVEGEDVAEGQRRIEADGGVHRRGFWGVAGVVKRCTPGGAQQATQQRIDGATSLVEPPDGGDAALAGLAGLATAGLQQLHVAARRRAGLRRCLAVGEIGGRPAQTCAPDHRCRAGQLFVQVDGLIR